MIPTKNFKICCLQCDDHYSFIYLESFISQPLTQVTVNVDLDEVTFSSSASDLLYVDSLGYVYAYQTGAETISDVCSGSCQVEKK